MKFFVFFCFLDERLLGSTALTTCFFLSPPQHTFIFLKAIFSQPFLIQYLFYYSCRASTCEEFFRNRKVNKLKNKLLNIVLFCGTFSEQYEIPKKKKRRSLKHYPSIKRFQQVIEEKRPFCFSCSN